MTEITRITRREFIKGAAGVAATTALVNPFEELIAAPARRKPNLLFIFPDQMRAQSLGCLGNTDVHTPNMDKLAKGGLLFSNCISNYPVCTPYRAALLTGRYATTTGVVANGVELQNSEITIAEVLKGQGYKTGYIGKWHLEKNGDPFVPKDRRQGFDYWAVRNTGGPHWDSYYCADTPDPVPMPGYAPDVQTKLAIDFIERNATHPFCLFLSWGPPHPKYDPPAKFAQMYDPAKLKQRKNVPNDTYRETLRQYYGAITALDSNVGKLIGALEKAGIADDTIVVFTSDHGDMMGSHGRIGKNVPWEEAINVPFILRYPRKVRAGGKTDLLLSTVDIMPTLLALCGAPIPKGVQGLDLSSHVLGKGGAKPESVLIERVFAAGREPGIPVQGWRGVRTARYTYVRGKDTPWLLYDNVADPYQMKNLIDKPEAKSIREKLDAELGKWLKKIGDDFATPDEWRKRIRGHASPRLMRGMEE